MNLSEYSRRPSCEVRIGRVVIGGGHPVAVQSMTNTDTNDTEASVAQIERIDRAGGKIVRLTAQGRREGENLARIVRRLRDAGLQFEAEARELASESLAGKTFVVSGKFSRSRDEMKELIEMHGGKNLAAVSGNVDYIVAGENMGPAKLKKAEKLGVKIISEEEFFAMIEGGSPAEKAAQQELF